MSAVVVGYVPKPEGRAALDTGPSEARLRGSRLVVVNSHRGGREFDAGDAIESRRQLDEVRSTLQEAGVETRDPPAASAGWTRPRTWSTWPPRWGDASSSSSACAAARRSAS